MSIDNTDARLGEAFASYQPQSLQPAVWARFRDDAKALVLRLRPSTDRQVTNYLSRLAVFLADVAPTRPDARLEDLLTPEYVAGHLQRARAAGAADGTVENRQGTLNALLRATHGRRRQSPRPAPTRIEPYAPGQVRGLLTAAVEDGSDDAADFARAVVVACIGLRLPNTRRNIRLDVEIDGATVRVAGQQIRFSKAVTLPPGGMVDRYSVQRGRAWAKSTLGVVLDVRRIDLARLCEQVPSVPAVAVVGVSGIGREWLTDAAAAAEPVGDDQLRAVLRAVQVEPSAAAVVIPDQTARRRSPMSTEEVHVATQRRPSKAEFRRRVRAAQQPEPPAPPLAPHIADYVAGYVPRAIDEETWQTVKPFVLDVLARYQPNALVSAQLRLGTLTAYAGWAHELGYPLTRETLLDCELIQAFVTAAGLPSSTAANYRSRLNGLVRKVNPGGRGPTVSVAVAHKAVKPPYDAGEVATIVRIAKTQPNAISARKLAACVAFGLGAGLDSMDLRDLRARHVHDRGADGIRIDVPGPRARTVWMIAAFEDLARRGLAGLRASSLVIGRKQDRRNVCAAVFEGAVILGNAPHFEQSRMRTTWLAWLLAARIPLPVIMQAAGLSSARTLTDLVGFVQVDVDAMPGLLREVQP